MISCPSCAEENPDGAVLCRMCSEKLVGPPRKDWNKLTLAEKLDQRFIDDIANRQESEDASERYHSKKTKSHAVTGILTFFFLRALFGFPYSLHPMELVLNAITSTIVGYPLGYLISWAGGGAVRGAFISGTAFTIMGLILYLPDLIFGGAEGIAFSVGSLIYMFGAGAIPGVYIGYHVELDQ